MATQEELNREMPRGLIVSFNPATRAYRIVSRTALYPGIPYGAELAVRFAETVDRWRKPEGTMAHVARHALRQRGWKP